MSAVVCAVEILIFHQTSCIETRRPTMDAALCRLDKVTSSLPSGRRSICVRLVFIRVAMRFFEILFSFIACASCQATTSLINGKCLCFFEDAFHFQEVVNTGTYVFPAH